MSERQKGRIGYHLFKKGSFSDMCVDTPDANPASEIFNANSSSYNSGLLIPDSRFSRSMERSFNADRWDNQFEETSWARRLAD
ncbi:MAG TPA: hypothetical protein VK633_06420 [Verrucomicrobiae bacterium]|nr:hypothetical protein [Verrucomicrobiae bacterium]